MWKIRNSSIQFISLCLNHRWFNFNFFSHVLDPKFSFLLLYYYSYHWYLYSYLVIVRVSVFVIKCHIFAGIPHSGVQNCVRMLINLFEYQIQYIVFGQHIAVNVNSIFIKSFEPKHSWKSIANFKDAVCGKSYLISNSSMLHLSFQHYFDIFFHLNAFVGTKCFVKKILLIAITVIVSDLKNGTMNTLYFNHVVESFIIFFLYFLVIKVLTCRFRNTFIFSLKNELKFHVV